MSDRLEFDSIEVSFNGRTLLSNIYMLCETGKVTGLLGRNGCGKTTLMKIVFGALPFEQKSVRVNGHSLGINYLRQKLIGYLPQSNLIPSYLSIRRAFSLFEVSEAELTDVFPEVVGMLDLNPAAISGGYLRIFETFLILRAGTKFCLLDEPFTGLTPLYIEKMKDVISAAKGTKGIVVSDHLHRHVSDVSDSLYLLANGQTYRVVDPEQLVSLGYISGA
ncbi:MAG: ATP-binding cassette domain-containing protein [Bacteroidota bacterium]|nr:ATP-binding cassette domain-containing protein [Bacteroidota bacterium]